MNPDSSTHALVAEMRSALLAHLEHEPPAGRDRRKGRYPIGLTDWDDQLDPPRQDDVPTRLVCLE